MGHVNHVYNQPYKIPTVLPIRFEGDEQVWLICFFRWKSLPYPMPNGYVKALNIFRSCTLFQHFNHPQSSTHCFLKCDPLFSYKIPFFFLLRLPYNKKTNCYLAKKKKKIVTICTLFKKYKEIIENLILNSYCWIMLHYIW